MCCLLVLSLVGFGRGEAVAAPMDGIEKLRAQAEEGLRAAEDGEKEKALQMLQEVLIRGKDIAIDNEEELNAELMCSVLAYVMTLRAELLGEEDKQLHLSSFSILITLAQGSDLSDYSILHPNLSGVENGFDNEPPEELLEKAGSLVDKGEWKKAETILLHLYDLAWNGDVCHEIKYKVSNALADLWIRFETIDKALVVLQRSKTDMDRKEMVGADYIETLRLIGRAERERGFYSLAGIYSDVSNLLETRLFDTGEILTMPAQTVYGNEEKKSESILDFIAENDKTFFLITDKDRADRWDNLRGRWERIKRNLANNGFADINELLNAFQYEKQLLLRSATKINEILKTAGNPELLTDLRRLRGRQMEIVNYEGVEVDTLENQLEKLEKQIVMKLSEDQISRALYSAVTTGDVAGRLLEDETFIDFGSIEGSGNRFYAIVINRETPSGWIVPLCKVEDLRSFIDGTQAQDTREMVRLRYSNDFLYRNIWQPIFDSGLIKKKILYCPASELGSVMPEAVMADDRFLGEDYEFHILSSIEMLDGLRSGETYRPETVTSFCVMDYYGEREALILEAQKYGCKRPVSKHFFDVDDDMHKAFQIREPISNIDKIEDYMWLEDLGRENNFNVSLVSGIQAGEYAFKSLSETYRGALNVSTHAFAYPADVNTWEVPYFMVTNSHLHNITPDGYELLPLFRTGFLLSGGERAWCGRNRIDDIEDGVVNGEELAVLDLGGVDLFTLLACSAGGGDIDRYEGVLGLRRSLKMAGCHTLVTPAWNVDREASLEYMKEFYTGLAEGKGISRSHREAQLELIKMFEEPYYWAPFQLVD